MNEMFYTIKMTTEEMLTAYYHLMQAARRYEQDVASAAEALENGYVSADSVKCWKKEASKARALAERLEALSRRGHDDQ